MVLLASSASRQSLPLPCRHTDDLAAATSAERLVGPLRQGDLAMFTAVSFLFAFSVFGDVTHGLFFLSQR